MHAMTQSRWRRAAAVAGVAGLTLLSACQDENRNPLAVAPPADLKIGLELSSSNAKVGDRVALAVRTDAGSEALQGFQGYVRFSPSKLTYVGQPAGDNLVLVNDRAALRGELRVIAVDAKGLSSRPVMLVFQVKAAVYDDGLRFEFEKAARHEVEITHATIARVVSTAPDLAVPEATRLSSVQWMQRLAPDLFKAEQKRHVNKPGEYLLNLKYGNVTRDAGNAINVLDVVGTANVSVGASALIDSTSKDVVIAGNVRPVNGGTGGTPRPGAVGATDGTIDVTDVVAIANEAVGTDVAVVGDLVPGRGPVSGNRAIVNADIVTDRTFFKDSTYQIGDASQGTVQVKSGATLTIQAGTRVEGWYGTQVYTGGIGSGQGNLVIARDGFLVAIGTVLEPITMTCVLPTLAGPLGQAAGTRWPGCWGGLFLHGNATINSDAGTPVNLVPSPLVTTGSGAGTITRSAGGCIQEQDEFSAIPYGGCNDADSSGVLRYVRSEYGGARFSATKERNGITFNAVGSHTQIDFVQSHASLDDGFEFFGGTANIKHMLATGNEDDNFDWVLGFRGQGQFLLQQSDSTNGDRCVEADNNGIDGGNADALPRSAPTFWNITCVGKKNPIRWTSVTGIPTTCATQLNSAGVAGQNCVNQAFEFRQNTAGTVRNAIAYRFAIGLDFDGNTAGNGGSTTGLCTNIGAGTLSFRSALISLGPLPGGTLNPSVAGDPDGSDPGGAGTCGGYTSDGTNLEAQYIADAANAITVFNAGDPNGDFLVDPLNVLAPDFRPKAGSAAATGGATPTGAFFDASATYYGAVAPANGTGSNVPWYSGWTVGYVSATGGPFAGWPQK